MIEHCDPDIWADGGHHGVVFGADLVTEYFVRYEMHRRHTRILCKLIFGQISTTATSSLRGRPPTLFQSQLSRVSDLPRPNCPNQRK